MIKTNLPCLQYKMILEISSKKVCGSVTSVQQMLPSATGPCLGKKGRLAGGRWAGTSRRLPAPVFRACRAAKARAGVHVAGALVPCP